MSFINRNNSFVIGNVVGLAILVGGILITAPAKMREQEELNIKETQQVVVASLDIAAGSTISKDNTKEMRIKHDVVPVNFVEFQKRILGLTTRDAIKKDTVVKFTMLELQAPVEEP
jgi:flagella basal body P-ring formation protein FlgA